MPDQPTAPKALSIRQPWAWAIIHAGKDIENRSEAGVKVMRKSVGQRVFIHAAKTFNRMDFEDSLEFLRKLRLSPPPPEALQFGGVIGSAKIESIVSHSRSRWFSGPRGLHLVAPRTCDFFPVRGQLGLFYVTPPEGIVP